MEANINKLQLEIKECENELNEEKLKQRELKNKVRSLHGLLQEKDSKISDLEQSSSIYSQEKSKRDKQFKNMELKLQKALEQNESLREKEGEASQRYNEFQRKLISAEESLKEKESTIASLNQEKLSMSNQIAESKKIEEKLQNKLSTLQNSLKEKASRMSKTEREGKNKLKEAGLEIKELNHKISSLESELVKTSGELERVTVAANSNVSNIQQMEELQQKISLLEEEIQQRDSRIEGLLSNKSDLETQLATETIERKELLLQFEKQKQILQSCEKEIQDSKASINHLEISNNNNQNHIKSQETELQTLKEKIVSLKTENEKIKRENRIAASKNSRNKVPEKELNSVISEVVKRNISESKSNASEASRQRNRRNKMVLSSNKDEKRPPLSKIEAEVSSSPNAVKLPVSRKRGASAKPNAKGQLTNEAKDDVFSIFNVLDSPPPSKKSRKG
ncbi:uncharacterized protein J8A68_004778 [[Candida] subhashii]|uniref:Uncharacterized protein n=1 Tax=[Candida] subhashii TaxID=561895 RepID=A0A8J5QQV4_9ASCO|nr:uncharacterized protein J8A68_004778 [[Candida] subhashii]KAG7661720.1 hypothetical protein J8A68_004778 [[Candida] subhashii]